MKIEDVKLYRDIYIGGSLHYGAKDKRRRGVDYILKLLPDVSGKAVLDVGCAGGGMSFALAGMGAYVRGIDVSEKRITAAQKLKDLYGIDNVSFECGSIWTVNIEVADTYRKFYDGWLLLNVLHHEKDPRFLLAAACTWANSWICIEHPIKGYYSTNNAEHPSDKVVVFGWKDVKKWVEKNGFVLSQERKSPDTFTHGRRCVGLFSRV